LDPISPRRKFAIGGRRGEIDDDDDDEEESEEEEAPAALATTDARRATEAAAGFAKETVETAASPLAEEEDSKRVITSLVLCFSSMVCVRVVQFFLALVSRSFITFSHSSSPSPSSVSPQKTSTPPRKSPKPMAFAVRAPSAIGARATRRTAAAKATAPSQRVGSMALPIRRCRSPSSSVVGHAIAAPPTNAPNHSVDFVSA
jgi:hypothetical protein